MPVDVRVILVAMNILCHGELPDREISGPVIAVDGGLHHCKERGIKPVAIVGDMDSVDPQLLEQYSDVEIHRHPTDKDKSDLELALELAATDCTVYGALGGRPDHLLYNLYLLTRFPMRLVGPGEELFAIKGHHSGPCRPNQTISLMPLGVAEGVTTHGLKWELQNATLDRSHMSLSNATLAQQLTVDVERGDLLAIISQIL
jgi:thiamine pyrophosphokinase